MNAPLPRSSQALEYANDYANAGLAVVPLHAAINQRCMCGNPGCKTPGAHAQHPTHGPLQSHRFAAAFGRLPTPNVGIMVGSSSGIFGLVASGADGKESLGLLEESHGVLPVTMTATNNRGVETRIFKLPAGAALRPDLGTSFPGIAVEFADTPMPVEPSSGPHALRWLDWELGDAITIADAPAWLLDLAMGKAAPASPVIDAVSEAPTAAAIVSDITNEEFLRAVIGELAPDESAWICGFPDMQRPNWTGRPVQLSEQHTLDFEACNMYFSAGVIRGPARQKKYMTRMAVLVVDDPQLDAITVPPSYVLETSPGNHQVGYIISSGGHDDAMCDSLMALVARRGWCDKSGNNPVRYARLPVGVNTKPRESGPFKHRLLEWHPERRYSLGDAARALGIDLTASSAPPAGAASPEPTTAAGTLAERIAGWRAALSDPRLAVRSYHSTLASWAASKIQTGTAAGAVVEELRAEMLMCRPTAEQCAAQSRSLDDELRRWQERFDDIPRAVSTAQEAFAPPVRDDVRVVDVDDVTAVTPTAVARIPGVLGQVEDYYNQTSIVRQPSFARSAAIALGSVALGRLYVARAQRDSYSAMYLCQVGATGSGKEHARTVIEELLLASGLSRLIGPHGYTSAAGVHSTVLAQPTHFTSLDELGRHLASVKNGKDSLQQQMFTELMKAYGSQHSSFRYRGYATIQLTAAQKKELAEQYTLSPSITLLGASTPDALYGAVGTAGIIDGFLNRMLFFFGDDTAKADAFGARGSSGVELPRDVIAWLQEVRTRRGDLWQYEGHDARPEPEILSFDQEALAVMRELQSEVEERRAARKGGLEEVWVRTVEKAIKLALIAAVSDGASDIGRAHAEWGASVALTSDQALERAASGNIAETEHGKLCNAIWRTVAEHTPAGGIAEGMLAKKCWPYKDARKRERDDAIKTLLADGRLTKQWHVARNGRRYEYLLATIAIEEERR